MPTLLIISPRYWLVNMMDKNIYQEAIDLFVGENDRMIIGDDIWGIIDDETLKETFDGKNPLAMLDEIALVYPILKQALDGLNELYHRDWDNKQLGIMQTTKAHQTYEEFADIMEHFNVFMIEALEANKK